MALPVLPLLAAAVLFVLGSSKSAKASNDTDKTTGKKKHVEVKRGTSKEAAAKKKVTPDPKSLKAYKDTEKKAKLVKDAAETVAQQAARSLRGFMLRTGKGRGDEVKKYQKQMGKIAADGIVGPLTVARAKALGTELPSVLLGDAVIKNKPAPKPVYGKVTAPKPKPKAVTPKPKPAPAPKPTLKPLPKPAPGPRPVKPMVLQREQEKPREERYVKETTMPTTLTPEKAAEQMRAYIKGGGNKGAKGAPNATVYKLQRAMGGVDLDGIYGPQTASRVAALLVPKDKRLSAREHAQRLAAHLGGGGSPGTRAKPSADVRAAQLGMGGGLVADGIYGDKTQARARELGVSLKSRSAYAA